MTKENTEHFDNLEIEKYLNDKDVVKDLFIKNARSQKHKDSKAVDKMKCKNCCNWNKVEEFNSFTFSDVSKYKRSNISISNYGDKLHEITTLESINKNDTDKKYEVNRKISETDSFSKYLEKPTIKSLKASHKSKTDLSTIKSKKSKIKRLKCQCKYSTKCLNEILNVCTKDKKCRKNPMKIKTLHKNYTRFIAMKIKPKKIKFHCLW